MQTNHIKKKIVLTLDPYLSRGQISLKPQYSLYYKNTEIRHKTFLTAALLLSQLVSKKNMISP
jgi:hypothetical protein